jgi:hypothetical protein
MEMAVIWAKIHNQELLNLCPPQNCVRIIESTRVKEAGHAERMRQVIKSYKVAGKSQGK